MPVSGLRGRASNFISKVHCQTLIQRSESTWKCGDRLLTNDAFGAFEARVPRRVVVTGLGLVTPIGLGVKAAWESLLKGACGIKSITADDLPKDQRVAFDGLPSKVAGTINNAELADFCQELAVPADSVRSARFIQVALAAAAEALRDADWHPETEADRHRTGAAIGSGMSATGELHTAAQSIAAGQPRRLSPFVVPRLLVNMAAGMVSMQHGLLGPNHAVSTACTTGAHSIGDAFNFIRHGDADLMLAGGGAHDGQFRDHRVAWVTGVAAGGTEACVDAIAIGSFARMRALETRCNHNPARASRPFDASRGGFVMGEGAGVMLLEEMEHALSRRAAIYAEVRGYGLSADAHHITQPAPDGRGALLAMQRALCKSSVAASDVAYINAHATSTPLGDAVEAAAIAKLFNFPQKDTAEKLMAHAMEPTVGSKNGLFEKGGQASLPLVSSTKGATGHLLGAAGAVEAIFTILSLFHSQAPPTLNLMQPDPALLGHALVANEVRGLRKHALAAMSNSFGFGGTNASLLFTVPPGVE